MIDPPMESRRQTLVVVADDIDQSVSVHSHLEVETDRTDEVEVMH